MIINLLFTSSSLSSTEVPFTYSVIGYSCGLSEPLKVNKYILIKVILLTGTEPFELKYYLKNIKMLYEQL